jgi:predicted RNA-binding Zn-ribbon protein involved in translation (DUF1610 family)
MTRIGQPPRNLGVPLACPECGEGARWRLLQVLGETPSAVDHHRVDPSTGRVDSRPIAHPRQGGGVKMRCSGCGFEADYRERRPGDPANVEPPSTV